MTSTAPHLSVRGVSLGPGIVGRADAMRARSICR